LDTAILILSQKMNFLRMGKLFALTRGLLMGDRDLHFAPTKAGDIREDGVV
jgi:hypothetical protein